MLLVVCPNLAIDRILEVDCFEGSKVQRSRPARTQPGGKGSNVARVFRQLGGDVVLLGFVGRANGRLISQPLQRLGIHVDTVAAYTGETRTCTIVCDRQAGSNPTVINEESPPIEVAAAARLLSKIERWIPRVDGVLTTGSLATGLPEDFYAQILDCARMRGKFTAIDAAGPILRTGLLARPSFMKPNADELANLTSGSGILTLAPHTALTFGKAGALLIHDGKCVYARPPQVLSVNPIGAGDAFAAAYLKSVLDQRPAAECLRVATAAAASDVATLFPGFIDISQLQSLTSQVELRFL